MTTSFIQGVGSDAMSIECTAECLESGEFVLNGLKMWITNGPCADVIVVSSISSNITNI